MDARSGQRNTGVHSEGRVQEEQAESESGRGERQSARTEWAKGKSAGYCPSVIEKRKRTRKRRRERSTAGGTGRPMRK
jgi:hypothetical protein